MKRFVSTLSVAMAVCLTSSAGQQRESPGKLEIQKHPLVLEAPAQPRPQGIDSQKLREEAEELARLAQAVPEQVVQITQGKISKDALEGLKRIEKLSKHLRAELAP